MGTSELLRRADYAVDVWKQAGRDPEDACFALVLQDLSQFADGIPRLLRVQGRVVHQEDGFAVVVFNAHQVGEAIRGHGLAGDEEGV